MRLLKKVTVCFMIILSGVFLSFNSQKIDIIFFPQDFNFLHAQVKIPVYVVMLAFTGLGLLLGVYFEFSRTWKDRRESRNKLKEVEKLNAHIKYLSRKGTSEADEILGLIK